MKPIFLYADHNTTDTKGSKSVFVKTKGHENVRMTVMTGNLQHLLFSHQQKT
jgi:hypothetical protein